MILLSSDQIKALVRNYSEGWFPMPDEETGIIGFYKSENRAIFPLDKMKRPRSLVQFLNKNPMNCTINRNFGYIVQKCSEREKT